MTWFWRIWPHEHRWYDREIHPLAGRAKVEAEGAPIVLTEYATAASYRPACRRCERAGEEADGWLARWNHRRRARRMMRAELRDVAAQLAEEYGYRVVLTPEHLQNLIARETPAVDDSDDAKGIYG